MLRGADLDVPRALISQEVQLGAGLLVHASLLHVADHADDGEPRRLVAETRLQPPPNRILLWIERLRQCLVHQDARAPPVASRGREVAAGDEPACPSSGQVTRRDGLVVVHVLDRTFLRRRVPSKSVSFAFTCRTGGKPVIAADAWTPGTCASRPFRRWKKSDALCGCDTSRPAARCRTSRARPVESGIDLRRFQKLRSNRPAPITRTTASATSAITSPLRTRARADPAVVRWPDSLSARSRPARAGAAAAPFQTARP